MGVHERGRARDPHRRRAWSGNNADRLGSQDGGECFVVGFDSRLERAAVANGLTVAAKIDHAAAARKAGLTLRPTTLIIAGNPAAGTPLMVADQTMAVELPLRFLVWQDEGGKAHVSYDPIKSIAARHKLTGQDQLLTKMTGAIELILSEATKP